jgi:hypothetical protein
MMRIGTKVSQILGGFFFFVISKVSFDVFNMSYEVWDKDQNGHVVKLFILGKWELFIACFEF